MIPYNKCTWPHCEEVAEPPAMRCPWHLASPPNPISSRRNNARWRRKVRDSQCKHCGTTGSEKNPLTIDHIIPLSKGGSNRKENIQTLCRKCHDVKDGMV